MARSRLPQSVPKPKPRSGERWLLVPAVLAVAAVVWGLVTVMMPPPAADPIRPRPVRKVRRGTEAPPAPAAATNLLTNDPVASPPPFYVAAAGRAPFPDYGEKMDKPIPARRLDSDDRGVAGSMVPVGIVPWYEARRYLGQVITAEGKIVKTHNTGKVCFLNFVEDFRGRFYVILFEDVLDRWPAPPEQYFLNKTIRVTGEVRTHNSTPQLQVRKAEQIVVVDQP